ncbi:MAG: hypothetical protein K0Q50_1539 [Vampirovibrio sp.]|jgi:uncharacterized protein (DUF58 family)|nr:hypothetical protein [Vampirovibrio sp.]
MDQITSAILGQLRDSLVQIAFVLGTILLLGRFAKAQPTWTVFALMLVPIPLMALTMRWPWLNWVIPIYNPLLMLVLLVDAFFLSTSANQLSMHRAMSRKFSIGQPNTVILSLMNTSGDTVTAVVRDSAPLGLRDGLSWDALTRPVQIPPYAQQEVAYELTPGHRGVFRFEKIHLRYRSRLGLLWLTLQGGRPESVKVMPDLRRLKWLRVMASKAQSAGELQKRSLGLEGTQFSGLRHYFAGDDIRKMAWQATAKLDVPVVRTFTHEVEQPILVLLDAGRKMQVPYQSASGKRLQKYDWALNAALAFMTVAIDRGDCVGVGVFSNKVIAHVPMGGGRHHLNRILEALGETSVQAIQPDYEAVMLQFSRSLKRRALVVVFTDLIDPLASRNLLSSLKSFSSNHLLMVVTLADNEAGQHVSTLPESAYDAYRQGVALDLSAMRQQALSVLAKVNNAIVIDVQADALDEALIQQYLQLKQRSRI